MKIPLSYYIAHWVKYTLMAIATGLVCGLFIFAPIGVPTGGALGLLFGQIAVFITFYGKRRGRFEFQYMSSLRRKEIKNALAQQTGYLKSLWQRLSEMGEISWSSGEKNKAFLVGELDAVKRFLFLYRLAILSKKDRGYEKSIAYFKQALEINPLDLLTNFTIAECYEKQGHGEKAIRFYRVARDEGAKLTNCLGKYIDSQIKRVIKKGPSKKPPTPGLMHSGLGR